MSKDNEEKGEVIEVQGEVQNEENQTSEKALAVSTEQENIQIYFLKK